ncbi:tetratricopeptide repeat protein [Desulfoscipio sp. XC116]|uniref:tetratricopeptide repeat protein n=1 Tax=Desulfoscipio sp. XC116 TaxID=3144975 RepID=UPI00325B1110
MKRISVTNRTLVILTVILGLILATGYFATPKLMAFVIKEYEQAGNQDKVVVLRERLIRFFPGTVEARWQAYALTDSFLQREERVIIGPGFITGGAEEYISVPPKEVIYCLQKVAAAQKEALWKYNIFEKLAEFYHFQSNYQEAEKHYLIAAHGFEEADPGFRIAEINVKLVDMYLEAGKLEKALSLIEQNLRKYPDLYHGEFLSWKGDVLFRLGDYGQAKECYRDALAQAEERWNRLRPEKEENINATLSQQPVYRHSESRLEIIRSMETGGEVQSGKVKGEILRENTPMPNVLVYLINEKEYDGCISEFEGLEYKTDAQGKFEFDRVVPGRYFIVLELVPGDLAGLGKFKELEEFTVEAGKTQELKYVFQSKVNILEPTGEQTFSPGEKLKIVWEEVPQAEAYHLLITLELDNGYVSRVYRSDLKGNSYLFNPQGLALRELNFVNRSDGDVLVPSAILGGFYQGAKIFFAIEAVDREGSSISDSEGYVLQLNGNYPSIQVQGTTPISPGDKLVMERKYPEAVNAYIKELKEKPRNPHALLSLARLYNYGWTKGTSDLRKAVGYYEQLLQIKRDKFLVEEAAGAHDQAGNYQIAIKLYEEIADEMSKSIFWDHHMGKLYLKTGQAEKALDYYRTYLNKEREFQDLGPVMAFLYHDNISGAIKLLKENSYSQRIRYNSDGETEKPADINLLISNLESYHNGAKSVLNRDDFHKYLREIINIDGSNRFEKVRAFQSKIASLGDKDVLVIVLGELAKDRR